jgi:gliding motility-associated-like protein
VPAIDPLGPITACATYALPPITGTNVTSNAAYYDDTQANGGQVITGSVTQSGTYYMYNGANGCSDEESVIITINPLPTVTSVMGGNVYCAGDVVNNIEAMVTGSANWTIDYTLDGVAQTASGSTSPITLGNAAGVYVVTNVTDANCTNTAAGSQTIVVNPIPVAPIAGTDFVYCSSWALNDMTVSGTGGTYTWYSDNTLTTVLGTGSSQSPIDVNGTSNYYVTETVAGCEGPADMVTITIEDCEIIVPTAITPNGDGIHDDWEIVDLDNVYPDNVVTVYNRWGAKLYESKKGNYASKPWDGKFEGSALPVASYYFVIDFNLPDVEPMKGIVSIVLDK